MIEQPAGLPARGAPAVYGSTDAVDGDGEAETAPRPSAWLVVDRRIALAAGALLALGVVVVVVAGMLGSGPSLPAGLRLDLAHTPAPPTATPGLADDPAVLDRLYARIAPSRRAYAVTASVAVTGVGHDATMSISGQVSGGNWRAEVRATPAEGPGRDARVVHVDGVTWWRRTPTAAWKRAGPDIADLPDVDIFSGVLVRGDLVYIGAALHDGAWVHHLAARSGWISDATREAGSAKGRQVNGARLDIWALPDGTPVAAAYTAEIGLIATAVRRSYAIATTYAFTAVGVKVDIKRPT